jgi:CheY-like chemotaxis protein
MQGLTMGHRLLVVDSDRRFLQDHKASLESAFDVDFRDGTEGSLAHLEAGGFAAILLCVEASENKGYSLCSAIRRSPLLADLKVALISAKATEEEYARHQSLKGKADLYLHKPMRPNALVSALTPLVPLKLVDPDNPLGDLGGDLGDEWLESLRSELEVETVPHQFPPQPQPQPTPPQPIQAQPTPPQPTPVPVSTLLGISRPMAPLTTQVIPKVPPIPKDAGRVELLEARVKDLETKLVVTSDDLERKQREVEELARNGETAQRLFEEKNQLAMDLEARLAEANGALMRSGRELEDLRRQSEETRDKLREQSQQAMDMMESNQLLQAQLAEVREQLESERGESLGAREQLELTLADLQKQLAEQEANHDRQQMELLAAIDDREARLGRMDEALNAQRDQIQFLEQEKHEAAGQLESRSGRLQAVIERLQDLEGQTRQALEFAKTEMN